LTDFHLCIDRYVTHSGGNDFRPHLPHLASISFLVYIFSSKKALWMSTIFTAVARKKFSSSCDVLWKKNIQMCSSLESKEAEFIISEKLVVIIIDKTVIIISITRWQHEQVSIQEISLLACNAV
jgi:hypothetical protein